MKCRDVLDCPDPLVFGHHWDCELAGRVRSPYRPPTLAELRALTTYDSFPDQNGRQYSSAAADPRPTWAEWMRRQIPRQRRRA